MGFMGFMDATLSGALAAALRAKKLPISRCSRCDESNYCTVEKVQLDHKEVLLWLEVVGERLDPSSSEIFSFLPSAQAWQASGTVREERRTDAGCTKVKLSCPAPAAPYLKDLYFCYAPGYSHVPISDLFVTEGACELEAPRNASFLSGYPGSRCHDSPAPEKHGMEDALGPKQSKRESDSRSDALICDWAARGEMICAAAEAKHQRVMCVLTNRLHSLQAFRTSWEAGDIVAFVQKLEACNDNSLPAAFLSRFAEHPEELHPAILARLLPMAQKLVQANCEEHAVAAVRFALQLLHVSWSGVAKALKSAGTPRVLFKACEEVVYQLQSMFAVVKTLSRSVKISKTNGPLVPLCKRLKGNLEEALANVGRLRS